MKREEKLQPATASVCQAVLELIQYMYIQRIFTYLVQCAGLGSLSFLHLFSSIWCVILNKLRESFYMKIAFVVY